MANDEAFARKVQSLLAFYRENRALFALLAEDAAPRAEQRKDGEQNTDAADEKNRPDKGADESILDAYLKAMGLGAR